MLENLEGKVTISHVRTGADGHIRIEIVDEKSHAIVAQAEMSYEQFGQAIGGMAFRPCTINVNNSPIIGKNREHKTGQVWVPKTVVAGMIAGNEPKRPLRFGNRMDGSDGLRMR